MGAEARILGSDRGACHVGIDPVDRHPALGGAMASDNVADLRPGDRRRHEPVDRHHADRDGQEGKDCLQDPERDAAEQGLAGLGCTLFLPRPSPGRSLWRRFAAGRERIGLLAQRAEVRHRRRAQPGLLRRGRARSPVARTRRGCGRRRRDVRRRLGLARRLRAGIAILIPHGLVRRSAGASRRRCASSPFAASRTRAPRSGGRARG